MKLIIDNKTDLYFCSDPHYHHRSIVRGTSNWEDKTPCRDFDTLEEHDNTLVENINNTVGENDILVCLGDWNFGHYKDSVHLAKEFRSRINCKTVHLILGNHDNHIKRNKEGVQGIFQSVSAMRDDVRVIDTRHNYKIDITLCHYAMRVWNKSHRGAFMLYGHSHNTLDQLDLNFADPTWVGDDYYIKNARTMDVGFDAHPEFRPFNWYEIYEKLIQIPVVMEVDHHKVK